MHAITEQCEQALYKRALFPYLLSECIIEPEGEVDSTCVDTFLATLPIPFEACS